MTAKPNASFEFHEIDGKVRCFKLQDGKRGPEVSAGLNFHRRAWMKDWKRLVEASHLPLIEIPLRPEGTSDQLAALPDDQEVVLRDAVAEYDVISSASRARQQLAERVARVKREQFSSREAAALLAQVTDDSKSSAFERIAAAFISGALAFRNTNGRFVADPARLDAWFGKSGPKYVLAEIGGEASAYTTRDEINKWLESIGHPDRIPGPECVGTGALPRNSGSTKRWTEALKAEARAYRDMHGLKKTAEHYGVSAATISRHIPAGADKPLSPGNWGGTLRK